MTTSVSSRARLGRTVFLLFALACADRRPVRAQAATIEGTVVSKTSGQAVPDADVTADGGASVRTGPTGRFRLAANGRGTVVLLVKAAGFLDLRVADVPVAGPAVIVELEATPNFLERVQVTATKTPLSVGDIGSQADIVDRAAIDTRGDQTLTQAIANVPGLLVSGQAGSFESVMLRGLPREGNEFTNTLLLIDGVPQVDSRNSARVVALPITDANSIEVVRGPNSALYGRTAIGGSVNVRTADPTPTHQLRASFTGGEFDLLKGQAAVSGPLASRGGYYVSVDRERNHGFYKSATPFGVDKTAVFGKVTFVPDAVSFGSVSLNRVVSDDSTPTNEPVIDGRFLHEIDPQFDRLASLNLEGPNYHQGETRATVNYTRALAPWARAVEIFGFRRIQYKFLPDGDVVGSPFDLTARSLTMYPFEQQTDEDIYYQEARLELTPGGARKQSITAGLSYERNTGATNGRLIFTDPDTEGWPLNYVTPVFPPQQAWEFDPYGSSYHVGVTGVFGQYIVEPGARWIVTAGGRYDRLALDNTRLSGATVKATFDAFSPKLSATYRLVAPGAGGGGPDINVYATYSRAFLPPRRPSQLSPASAQVTLAPEDIDNVEGGLKASLAGGRLALEATAFNMIRSGMVVQVRQGPFFRDSNAGEQKFRGLELGARWTPSSRASAYVNTAFYRPRFGTFVIQSAGGDTVLTGNRVPIAPDLIVNGGVTLTPVPAVDLSVNVKRVGAQQIDQLNSFVLPGYTLADAAASWTRGPVRFTLSAHNLFDAEYYWGGDTSLGETADPGRPRQVLFTTSVLLR